MKREINRMYLLLPINFDYHLYNISKRHHKKKEESNSEEEEEEEEEDDEEGIWVEKKISKYYM